MFYGVILYQIGLLVDMKKIIYQEEEDYVLMVLILQVRCLVCIIFENEVKLFGFLQNVSENLKGGHFIICLFDGKRIFDLLKSKDIYEQKDEKDTLCWSIRKKYTNTSFKNDKSSLGMTQVYVNTFHKEIDEYLKLI